LVHPHAKKYHADYDHCDQSHGQLDVLLHFTSFNVVGNVVDYNRIRIAFHYYFPPVHPHGSGLITWYSNKGLGLASFFFFNACFLSLVAFLTACSAASHTAHRK
jgi:hypothetical protein